MIPVLSPRPFIQPLASPAGLVVALYPPARTSHSHVAGSGSGSRGSYPDLNAFFWYTPGGGWATANRGHKGLARTARGIEDGRSSTR